MKRVIITVGLILVIGVVLIGCISQSQSKTELIGNWKGSFEHNTENGTMEMWQQFEFTENKVINKISKNKSMKPLRTGTRKGTYSVEGNVITIHYEKVWFLEDEEWVDFPEDNDPVRSAPYSLKGNTLLIGGNEFIRQ
jgi:hypothetical protein